MTLESTSTIIVLGHFANFKLAGDRAVRDAVENLRRDKHHPSSVHPGHHPAAANRLLSSGSAQARFLPASLSSSFGPGNHPSRGGLPRRRRRNAPRGAIPPSSYGRGSQPHSHANANHLYAQGVSRSTRVGIMSDADLEAELATRRASRLRERDRYAKAMRTEKLSLLEGELMRLRSEISRLDRPSGGGLSLPGGVGGGTPPTARWEALPNGPRGSLNNSNGMPYAPGWPQTPGSMPAQQMGGAPPHPSPQGGGGFAPPPPPPPMRPLPGGDDDDEPIDPERQKREKEERVKRREAKRRERENAKKPLTLAEIIRGAGPDPMGKLKPSGSTQLKDVHDPDAEVETENFTDVKDALKKMGGPGDGEGKEDEAKEESAADEEKKKDGVDAGGASEEKKAEVGGGEIKKENGKEGTTGEDEKTEDKTEDKTENDEKKATESKVEEDTKKTGTKTKSEEAATQTSETGVANGDASSNGDKKEAKSKEVKTGGDSTESAKKEEDSTKDKAVDALAALQALTSKLPTAKAKGVSSPDAASETGGTGVRKRKTLEEKRRLRRELSKGSEDATAMNGDGHQDEAEDLKVD